MTKKILIIGGTGFIGYHIAKSCLKLKWSVLSISLNKPKKIRKLKKIKYLMIDISNKKELWKLDKYKFNYVINLGGYVNHTNKPQIKKHHYLGVQNLFNYFKKKNLEKFIQVGSSAEYGKTRMPQKENFNCKPIGLYGKFKLKASKFLLKEYTKNHFPVTILRLYQVYGPAQDQNRFIPILIKSCIHKRNFNSSTGIQKRDFLFINDAVKVFLKVLSSKKTNGQILNIGFGKSVTLKKIMNFVGKKTNFFSPKFGKIKIRKDEALNIYPDIKKARKMLDWRPIYNWEKGVLKTIQYFKTYNEKK